MIDVLRRGEAFGAKDPLGHMGARVSLHANHPPILYMHHGVTTLVAAEALGLVNRGPQSYVLFHRLQFLCAPRGNGFRPGNFLEITPNQLPAEGLQLAVPAKEQTVMIFHSLFFSQVNQPFLYLPLHEWLAAAPANGIRHNEWLLSLF
jgi:hypothetical protein